MDAFLIVFDRVLIGLETNGVYLTPMGIKPLLDWSPIGENWGDMKRNVYDATMDRTGGRGLLPQPPVVSMP